jgi:hypothetical protein
VDFFFAVSAQSSAIPTPQNPLSSKWPRPTGKKSHKKRTESYSSYIYKVLKQVHPNTGISKKPMSIISPFIDDIFDRLAGEAGKGRRMHTHNQPPPGRPLWFTLRAAFMSHRE